jgi:redox-sensing transcriptional repressor
LCTGARRDAMKGQRIPPATVARLPIYRQCLQSLLNRGEEVASSHRLAEATGIEAPQIRRDLSYLGALGTRGVGYEVRELLREVSHSLGLSRSWPVAIVGCGKLGAALAAYEGFPRRNFHIDAIFDCDPSIIGSSVEGIQVMSFDQIAEVVRERCIGIGVVATDPDWAPLTVRQLVQGGVTSILNLSPVTIAPADGVVIRNIDLAAEMQILSFNESLKGMLDGHPAVHPSAKARAETWLKGWL